MLELSVHGWALLTPAIIAMGISMSGLYLFRFYVVVWMGINHDSK